MRIITVVFLFLMQTYIYAQLAIIDDPDGYTNVRFEPNGQSEVIHKINLSEVFWYDRDNNDEFQDWIRVYVPKNKFSLGCGKFYDIVGYMHKSRLKPLEELSVYNNDDLVFEYIIADFDSKNRIIDYGGEKLVTAIDGRTVWGTDGNLPKTYITGIHAVVEGKEINIHEAIYGDLYQCNNKFSVYKNGDTYFLHQSNSDGAGYYEVVWVLTNEGLKQRLVGSMF